MQPTMTYDYDARDEEVLEEVKLEFSENTEIGEGTCSCVCISDENCCGCLMQ